MSELEEAQNAAGHLAHSRVARFWLRELPYIAVLALTILGVAIPACRSSLSSAIGSSLLWRSGLSA